MEAKQNRKLRAVLFADIANYTGMMQKDENLARQSVHKFRRTVQEKTTEFNGQIVSFQGDGCFCLFDSSVNALNCALQIQKIFLDEPVVPVRIGLHSGDVYFEEENVYGDSVNLASRIESLSIPGAVLFSERIKKDIKNQKSFRPISLGQFHFKNVEESMEVFALANQGLAVPKKGEIKGKTIQPKGLLSKSVLKIALPAFALLAIFFLTINLSGFRNIIGKNQETYVKTKSTLAVLDFTNNTSNEKYDNVAKMVSNRIIHGITQNDLAGVITGETVTEYDKILLASNAPQDKLTFLNKHFGVEKVIDGNLYLEGEELLFECTVTDAISREIIRGIEPVRCPTNNPSDCVKKLKQSVLGFIASTTDKELNLLLETHIPKFEAFEQLLLAKETQNNEKELEHLNKAIEIDSNYFEPKALILSWYYNAGKFEYLDSLLRTFDNNLKTGDKRQKNLLNFYDALLKGNNRLIYQYLDNEYQIAPFDLPTNNTMLVLALQFIYDVDEAFKTYKVIPEKELDFASCPDCRTRLYIKVFMDLENGNPNQAIKTATLLRENGGGTLARSLLIRAYVQAEKWNDLQLFIENEKNTNPDEDMSSLYLYAAEASILSGNSTQTEFYANQALKNVTVKTDLADLGETHLILDQLNEAEQALLTAIELDSLNLNALSLLAGVKLKLGKTNEADGIISQLNRQRTKYQFGDIDYYLAYTYIIGNDPEKALGHLKTSVAQGQRYGFHQYKNDYFFVSIRDKDEFKQLLSYWL